jgi:hypothetical protein
MKDVHYPAIADEVFMCGLNVESKGSTVWQHRTIHYISITFCDIKILSKGILVSLFWY